MSGVPHADFGEAVVAVVVPKPRAALDGVAIGADLKAKIANLKGLKAVSVADDLPRNAMGKVQKNLLRGAAQGAVRRRMSAAPGPAAADRCTRCGSSFHCGSNDAAPCACTTVTLSAALQQHLREAYLGCRCVRCLHELTTAPADGEASGPAQRQR